MKKLVNVCCAYAIVEKAVEKAISRTAYNSLDDMTCKEYDDTIASAVVYLKAVGLPSAMVEDID